MTKMGIEPTIENYDYQRNGYQSDSSENSGEIVFNENQSFDWYERSARKPR